MPDRAAGFWALHDIRIRGTDGPMLVQGYSYIGNEALCVTPEIRRDGKASTLWVVTHAATGVRLWPDGFPLERAQALCLELLKLPGWVFPRALENVRLIDAATLIAKTYMADTRVLS